MSTNIVVTLPDPDGSVYEALEAQLIEPWDEFYAPLDEEVEGFDIQWRPVGTTTLRVRIEDGAAGPGPLDIDAVIADLDRAIYDALDAQLIDPWDEFYAPSGASVSGFTIEYAAPVTRFVVHVD